MSTYTEQALQWLALWILLGLALRFAAVNTKRSGRNHDHQ